jgi:hypothetical protein
MRWAQFLILGHLYVFGLTVYKGWPLLVPLMISFGPFYNGWLFFLCNSTQHVGLSHGDFRQQSEKGRPVVNDFRLTTRTFYIGNPLVQFWCVRAGAAAAAAAAAFVVVVNDVVVFLLLMIAYDDEESSCPHNKQCTNNCRCCLLPAACRRPGTGT